MEEIDRMEERAKEERRKIQGKEKDKKNFRQDIVKELSSLDIASF